ncbi:MAG: TerB family tellurite resistance protein [Polyangiaceae bacterium]|nr:TerB family tellurite resistance protein [Polyangiaceae bacterium]
MAEGPPDTPPDPTAALARLSGALTEDALFVLGSAAHDREGLEALLQRRAAAYDAAVHDRPFARMTGSFEAWLVDLSRAMAPVAPPPWLPMMDVVREKVTLEIGARGLRSLFSSKPSEKDVARVKRYGALAVRTLRAVFAADGPIDAEERATVNAVVAALGLPEGDAGLLAAEGPLAPETFDIYGEIDRNVARAIVRGAWLGAAGDGLDPREEQAIRVVARKMGVVDEDVEAARREGQERVDGRSRTGVAAVDGVRFVLSDRIPGVGVQIGALVGSLMVPRRFRPEALSLVGHGGPVVLAHRHAQLAPTERAAVLGVVWTAALIEGPTVARRALLQARWERFASDLGEDDPRPREIVERWLHDALAAAARTWT